MNKSKAEIIKLVNSWLNNSNDFQTDRVLKVYEDTMEEHEHSYSFSWCFADEEHFPREEKTLIVGIRRVFISKSGDKIDFEGSAPFTDFLKEFELKVQGLQEYWLLEIPLKKQHTGKLKTLLNWTTPELIKNVNKDSKIVFSEECDHSERSLNLDRIADDLKTSNIEYSLTLKQKNDSSYR